MNRVVVLIAVVAVAVTGCGTVKDMKGLSKVKQLVIKDIALEDQLALLDKYVGKPAWTRLSVEDLTERETPGEPKKRVVPRDTKIEIVDLAFVHRGALTILDHKGRNIVVALEIERPLSVEKIETRLGEILWFEDPMIRHVGYIRKWGKRTARAVVNHEVFIGMPREAAFESWGIPSKINTNEIGGKREEQWVYKEALKSRYIYIIDGKVSKWED